MSSLGNGVFTAAAAVAVGVLVWSNVQLIQVSNSALAGMKDALALLEESRKNEDSPLAVGVCSDELEAFEGAETYCRMVDGAIEDIKELKDWCAIENMVNGARLEQAIIAGDVPEGDREQLRYSDLFDYQACYGGHVNVVNVQLYDIFSKNVLANIDLDAPFPAVVSDEFERLADAMPQVQVIDLDRVP